MSKESNFASVPDDPEFAVLLKEYELRSVNYDHAMDKFFQFIAWIIAILTTFITIITTSPLNSQQLSVYFSWFAWLGPFMAVFMFYLLLFQYYEAEGLIRKCRVVMEEINKKLDEPIITQFSNVGEGASIVKFFSIRHGNIKYRILVWAEIILCCTLYFAASILSLIYIYSQNHLGGFIIAIFFIVATSILAYSFSGALIDLPKYYNSVQEGVQKGSLFKIPDYLNNVQSGWKNIIAFIFPRPRDVIEKGVVFWYGFIAAIAILGIQNNQLKIINILFKYRANDFNISSIPPWVIFGIGIVYFFVEEIILQQAKLLWDDIRDVERDRQSPHHKLRAYTSGVLSKNYAIFHVIFRWGLSMILGYLLGGIVLLGLFVLITLHQAIYVLWGKPRGDKRQLELLLIISFNVSFRFIAGVMAVVGISWTYLPFLVLFAIFHFYSFGFMAALWRMEAVHIKNNSAPDIVERPQSQYFYSNGDVLRYQGQLGAILLSSILIATYLFFSNCNGNVPSYLDWMGQCSQQKFIFSNYGVIPSVGFVLTLIVVIHLLTLVIRKIFTPINSPIRNGLRKIKSSVMIVSFLLFILLLIVSTRGSKFALAYFFGVFFMNFGLLAMLEGMKYNDFVGKEMMRQIPHLLKLWIVYFFNPPQENLSIKILLSTTILVMNNKKVFSEAGEYIQS